MGVQLAQLSPSTTSTTLAYSNPPRRTTIVRNISVVNYSASSVSYTIYLNAFTGEAENKHVVVKNGNLAANDTDTFWGEWNLSEKGKGAIHVVASAADSVTFTFDGERVQ